MMLSQNASRNPFLTAPLSRLFVKNVVPMMVMMMMSGLLTVADAAFLGHFVGADALAAVSIIFPVLMIILAVSTLVSGGMSSLYARKLGAGDRKGAGAVFAQAHGLALFLSFVLILVFLLGGRFVINRLAGDAPRIADMAMTYLAIMIYAAPIQFFLGVHADAGRNEGHVGLMAFMSVGVALGNVILNWLLIAVLDMGVAGSAWGTVIAQTAGLLFIMGVRWQDKGSLPLSVVGRSSWFGGWRSLVSLGAPLSLRFAGIALIAAVVVTVLRLTSGADYAQSVAGYGVVTRIMSFAFMPLMAISLATQSIVGNNFGAGLFQRSNTALWFAISVAFLYCLTFEIMLLYSSNWIGLGFVTEPDVVVKVGEILRPTIALYITAGPILILAMYFQAIGRPGRAALLSLIRPFILCPVLIVVLGVFYGSGSIWFAFTIADALMLVLAVMIVFKNRTQMTKTVAFGAQNVEGYP